MNSEFTTEPTEELSEALLGDCGLIERVQELHALRSRGRGKEAPNRESRARGSKRLEKAECNLAEKSPVVKSSSEHQAAFTTKRPASALTRFFAWANN